MSETAAIARAIQRISAWFDTHAPEHAPEFVPPVAGVSGPLSELYAAVGGQTDHQDVFDFHSLLSPEDALRERQMMDELASTEPWPDTWWHPSWVPFASDFAGQLLVVHEQSGQVIAFIHDDEPREVLAASLSDYFEGIASDLEDGVRVFDERFGVVFASDLERLIAVQEKRTAAAPHGSPVGFYLAAALFALLAMGLAYALDL